MRRTATEFCWKFVCLLLPLLGLSFASLTYAQTSTGLPPSPADPSDHAINIKAADLKWEKIMPELGEESPEVVFLHKDPKTQATELMIRIKGDFHVPRHWHSANETHTVLQGTLVMECHGEKAELSAGSFNYIPARMVHQAWSKNEPAVLFITVDGAWDVNWVDGPPQPQKKQPSE